MTNCEILKICKCGKPRQAEQRHAKPSNAKKNIYIDFYIQKNRYIYI
jgi:hypothetical protein